MLPPAPGRHLQPPPPPLAPPRLPPPPLLARTHHAGEQLSLEVCDHLVRCVYYERDGVLSIAYGVSASPEGTISARRILTAGELPAVVTDPDSLAMLKKPAAERPYLHKNGEVVISDIPVTIEPSQVRAVGVCTAPALVFNIALARGEESVASFTLALLDGTLVVRSALSPLPSPPIATLECPSPGVTPTPTTVGSGPGISITRPALPPPRPHSCSLTSATPLSWRAGDAPADAARGTSGRGQLPPAPPAARIIAAKSAALRHGALA